MLVKLYKPQLIFFLICASIFTISKFMFVYQTESERVLPVEPDDAMVYLLRSSLKETCENQTCKALETLKRQIYQSDSPPSTDYNRSMQEASLLVQYTFAHTFFIDLINALTNDWNFSLKLFRYLAILFIGISLSFFVYAFWGPIASGLTLGLLSFHLFKSQGIFIPVPSNIAIAVSMLSWALLIHTKKESYSVYFLQLVAILFHPMGKLLALVLASSVFIYRIRTRNIKRIYICILFFIFVLISIALPFIVKSPPLAFNFADRGPMIGLFEKISFNLKAITGNYSLKSMLIFFLPLCSWLVCLFYSKNEKINLKNLFLIGTLFLCIVSCIHYLPNYPGELFNRVAIVFSFLFLPAFFTACISLTPESLKKLTLLFLIFGVAIISSTKIAAFSRNIELRVQRHNYSSPVYIFDKIVGSNCSLYFDDEIPMFFSLTWGNLSCSYFYTPIDLSPDSIIENSGSQFFVSLNPFSRITNTQSKDLKINLEDSLNRQWVVKYKVFEQVRDVTIKNGVPIVLPKFSKILSITNRKSNRDFPWEERVNFIINSIAVKLPILNLVPSKVSSIFNQSEIIFQNQDYLIIKAR